MKILLATGIESLERKLKDELAVELGYDADEGYYREMDIKGYDVVVISPALPGKRDITELIYSLRENNVRVVLLAGTLTSQQLKKIVNMGVYDVIFDPVRCADIIDTIRNPKTFKEVAYLTKIQDEQNESEECKIEKIVVKEIKKVTRQQVVTWWSASGGEGKTTLATAQAFMLAKHTGDKVALLDFNEVTSHCSWYLGVEPYDPTPIYDAIEKNDLSLETLENHMVEHPKHKNFKIFTGVPLRRYESFKVEHYNAIIDTLVNYPYIIIDTNAGIFYASTYTALKKASKINVVAEPLYRSIYDTREMIDFATKTWKMPRDIFNVVINKMNFDGIDTDEIKAGLKDIKVYNVFKYDKKVIKLLNQGIPPTIGFEKLVEDFGIQMKRKKNLFGFITNFKKKRGAVNGSN